MTMLGMLAELYDTISNLKRLRDMAYYKCKVLVRRMDDEGSIMLRHIDSDDIVPGD